MSITYIPRQKSGMEAFNESFSPYLQQAFSILLQKKLQDQQRQQSIEQTQKMFPEAFTQSLNPAGQAKYNMDIVSPDMRESALSQVMPSIPQQYKQTAFNPQAAQKYPGLGMNFRTGEMEYKVPTPDIFTQIANYNNAKSSGLIPEGMDITGVSGKNVQIGSDVPRKKFEMEEAEKQTQLQDKTDFIINQAQDSLNTISEVKSGISNFGLTGQLPSIPGTKRYIWETNINKLLSGKMIDLMVTMKEASKTGATGFGQLSEKEGQILREASTALKRGLPPEKAKEYLDKMEIVLKKVIQKKGGGKEQAQGDFSGMSDEELRRIASGS